jgi:competence protein ComEC
MFQRFPFVRFTFFFALGIVSRHYLGEVVLLPQLLLFAVILGYLLLLFKNSLEYQRVLAILGFVLLFSLGAYRLDFFLVDDVGDFESTKAYKAQLISEPEEKKNSARAVLEVYELLNDSGWVKSESRVNGYFSKEEGLTLSYGDLLLIDGAPNETTPPANPGEFDYRNYLAYQNIHFQQFVGDDFDVIGHAEPNWFVARAIKIREVCVAQLSQYIENPKSRAVVLALVLGVKDELDNELIQSFSATGATHVLAVSGLHVGIIFGIIFWVLKAVGLHKRKYRWWMAAISILVLWTYALLTGLSPSVLRAVTMFSFVALGRALFRRGNIYNTLSLSALALLLYNPYLIMSVGFQLSFLAVFGIVYLHPKVYGLWQVDNCFLDKVWSITCVSIAAQLATGPLSMLYFHQFPTYFLVSNLFIIPAAFAILIGGLILLALSFAPAIAALFGIVLGGLVSLVNWLVAQVSRFPNSAIDGVYFSILDTWLVYAVLGGIILFLVTKKGAYLKLGLSCALAFSISQIAHFSSHSDSLELSVLNASNHSVIDLRAGFKGRVFANDEFLNDPESQQFSLSGKRLISGVKQKITEDELVVPEANLPFGKLMVFDGKSIFWLNSPLGDFDFDSIEVDFLIISNNSVKNLDQLHGLVSANQVILDKSNSFYTQRSLLEGAKENQVDIHQVSANGYFSSLWRK